MNYKKQRVIVLTAGGLAVIALAFSIFGLMYVLQHRPAPRPQTVPVGQPCGSNAPACIRITEHDGTKYQLNDFRFYGIGCVAFISLPDHVRRDTCQPFNLTWIGPADVKRQGV